MATDQKTSITVADSENAGSVIENELPTYRAISATAISSVVCGVLSVCSFAHPVFYVFSILAIGLGIMAHRAIRRYPDMLTGPGWRTRASPWDWCSDSRPARSRRCSLSSGTGRPSNSPGGSSWSSNRQISVICSNSRHLQPSGRGRANSSLSKSSKQSRRAQSPGSSSVRARWPN